VSQNTLRAYRESSRQFIELLRRQERPTEPTLIEHGDVQGFLASVRGRGAKDSGLAGSRSWLRRRGLPRWGDRDRQPTLRRWGAASAAPLLPGIAYAHGPASDTLGKDPSVEMLMISWRPVPSR
jgi:hypothetical protein